MASVTNTRRLSSASEDQHNPINKRKHSIGGGGGGAGSSLTDTTETSQSLRRRSHAIATNQRLSVARPLNMDDKENQSRKQAASSVQVQSNTQPLNETLGLSNFSADDHRNQYNSQITNQYQVVWVMKWVDYTNR